MCQRQEGGVGGFVQELRGNERIGDAPNEPLLPRDGNEGVIEKRCRGCRPCVARDDSAAVLRGVSGRRRKDARRLTFSSETETGRVCDGMCRGRLVLVGV